MEDAVQTTEEAIDNVSEDTAAKSGTDANGNDDPSGKPVSSEVIDHEAILRQEIAELQQASSLSSKEHKERKTRFSILETGCKGTIFVRFHKKSDSPLQVIKSIMQDFIRDPDTNLRTRCVNMAVLS